MKIKICRKDAKESRLWLSLAEPLDKDNQTKQLLMTESTELIRIFSAILINSK
jgi:hypothetical protein